MIALDLLRKNPICSLSLLALLSALAPAAQVLASSEANPPAAPATPAKAGQALELTQAGSELEAAAEPETAKPETANLEPLTEAAALSSPAGLSDRGPALQIGQTAPPTAEEAESLDYSFPEGGGLRITVTGTRTPRSVNALPATVTVFDLNDLQFNGVQNLRELLRYEPGVSVRNDLRFGFQDVNIRGIEGNRILFQLDGIRLPERFEFGPFNIGRGDYVDFATLSTVEVLRGAGLHALRQRRPRRGVDFSLAAP